MRWQFGVVFQKKETLTNRRYKCALFRHCH